MNSEKVDYKHFEAVPAPGKATFTELVKDFVLFTPALFFTFVELDVDPTQKFVDEQNSAPTLFCLSLEKPIFRGMTFRNGDDSWNYRIMGIERGKFPDLNASLLSWSIVNRHLRGYFQPFVKNVFIVDQRALYRKILAGTPFKVGCSVYLFKSNLGTTRIKVEHEPPNCPKVIVGSPDPEASKIADKLFGRDCL